MKTILANKQKWNKRGVELTINFIVTLILALAAFALGAVIIKTLTAGGTDSIDLTQKQLDEKISQLSCSSRDRICVSNNNKAIVGGDVVIVGLAVYNIQSEPVALAVSVTPKRGYKKDGSQFDVNSQFGPTTSDPTMPYRLVTQAPLEINAKTQGQLAIGIITTKETPEGKYLFKVSVAEDTSLTNTGFQEISDEISITVK